MPNLSIKDVPEAVAEKLRQRAARNHRSLQGELMALLEAAVAPAEPVSGAPVGSPGRRTAAARPKSFADAAAEFRRRFPAPVGGALESAHIVREMRDTHYGDAWVMAGIKDGHWPPQAGDSAPIPGFGIVQGLKPDTGAEKK